jgi:hypothetical protein
MHGSHRIAMPMPSAMSSFSRRVSAPSPMSFLYIIPKPWPMSGACSFIAVIVAGHVS